VKAFPLSVDPPPALMQIISPTDVMATSLQMARPLSRSGPRSVPAAPALPRRFPFPGGISRARSGVIDRTAAAEDRPAFGRRSSSVDGECAFADDMAVRSRHAAFELSEDAQASKPRLGPRRSRTIEARWRDPFGGTGGSEAESSVPLFKALLGANLDILLSEWMPGREGRTSASGDCDF